MFFLRIRAKPVDASNDITRGSLSFGPGETLDNYYFQNRWTTEEDQPVQNDEDVETDD